MALNSRVNTIELYKSVKDGVGGVPDLNFVRNDQESKIII